MQTNNQIEEIANKIQNSEDKLAPFKELIGKDNFSKFQNIKKTFEADAKAKEDENRLLRIGIIGQIKRGKSSFLNALLFDGRDILPKGATPMTAALTKIRYSFSPYAKLSFYTTQDWESIKQKALQTKEDEQNEDFEGEISEEDKACLEIYTKAKNVDILSKLGEIQTIDDVSKIEDLLEKLENYVGADGIYTPIVKSLELGVDIESIKNIEIVDTPGTNDPVISRGRVTQDFIGQCDVVFFLSLSSQFLDQNDMELIAQNIPKKGVENIFLVGSLFDSAMLDTYNDYENTSDLIENLKYKYSIRAKEDIDKIISFNSDDSIGNSLLKALPPIFVSGMCYNIATNLKNLSEEENHTLKNLNEMYNDSFDKDDLLYIANIEGVQEKIDIVTAKKDEILKSAFSKVIDGATKQLDSLYVDIEKNVKSDFEMLQNNDVASLEKKQHIIQKSIKKGTSKIDNIFESYIIDIEKSFASLAQQLKNEIKNTENVNVESGSDTEEYEVSTSKWYNPFSYGRTETKTRTINYKYANVYDAIEQVEDFVRVSELNISKTVENIIDIETFRKEIMQNIIGLFDLKDDDFDPRDIVDTLKNSVNRISIPNVDIDTSSHIDTIRDNFSSSEVKDSKIDSFKKEIKRVLKLILGDMKVEILSQTKKIISELNQAKDNFIPKLLKDSNDKLDNMKNNMSKLNETKEQYEELFIILKNHK